METVKKNKAWLRLLLIIAVPVVVFCLILIFILQQVSSQRLSVGFAVLILIILLVVLEAIVFGFIEGILRNLRKMVRNFDKIADGSVSLDGNRLTERNDEIGQMMRNVNEMVKSFAKIVVGIRNATDSLDILSGNFRESFDRMATDMEQVGRAVESITSNTVSQADQTKSIQSEILDISHAIEMIAANIEGLTKSADKMKEYNEASESIMQELVAISEENSGSIESVRSQTDITNRSALEIQQATEIIAGIASQTNLLALNASIEAARAGEQGKGFAVVAEEIRTLADQSRESSEHISKIVNALIDNSNVSVNITQKVSDAFVQQNEKIHTSKGIFTKLNQEIVKVGTSIDEINVEVNALDKHKNVMKEDIISLAGSAECNTASARETADAMLEFEGVVSDCKQATEQITAVTRELVGNIEKVGMKAEQRKVLIKR